MKTLLLEWRKQTSGYSLRLSACTALLIAIFLFGCNPGQPESVAGDGEVTIDTLRTDTFTVLIDTDSGLFANPVEIVHMDDDRFAVLDFSQNVVKVLNREGGELFQFGGQGRGPGEWAEGSNYLNYTDGRFLITDTEGMRLNIYDDTGNPLTSYTIESWARYSSKHLINGAKVLLGTDGWEGALAIVADLQNLNTIPYKIGEPEAPVPGAFLDLNDVAAAIASGDIPSRIASETVLTVGNGGYYLFMNALGELRFYSEDGSMEWSVDMPDPAKSALREHVIERNENVPPGAYAGLAYAVGIRYSNEHVYILTTPAPGIHQHLLVYSAGGELQRHIVLDNNIDSDSAPYFGRFDLLPDGTFLLPDLRNAQILTFQL